MIDQKKQKTIIRFAILRVSEMKKSEMTKNQEEEFQLKRPYSHIMGCQSFKLLSV